jgi:hypothetical protein
LKCDKCGIDKDKLLEHIELLESIIKLQAQEIVADLEETLAMLNESTKRHKK